MFLQSAVILYIDFIDIIFIYLLKKKKLVITGRATTVIITFDMFKRSELWLTFRPRLSCTLCQNKVFFGASENNT